MTFGLAVHKPPNDSCYHNLVLMLHTCSNMGFTTNPDKTVLPTTSLVLLGVELDTVSQEIHIDPARLTDTIDLLEH